MNETLCLDILCGPPSMKFPQKLAQWLELKGITQSAAAKRVGLSQSAISDMTAGRRRPYLDQGLALARLIGCSLDSLADDAIDEPTTDGLTDDERRLLWLAELVGMETALRRVAKGDEGETASDTSLNAKERAGRRQVMADQAAQERAAKLEGNRQSKEPKESAFAYYNVATEYVDDDQADEPPRDTDPPRVVGLQNTTESLLREIREKERPKRVERKTDQAARKKQDKK